MLKGLITALTTPFNKMLEIDKERFTQQIKEQLDAGVKTILLLGTTGENFLLDQEEKLTLLQSAKETVSGKASLLVCISGFSTKQTIEELKRYEPFADAFLVMTPPYIKPSQEGLFNHFKTLAENGKKPLYLYNNPGRAQVSLTVETTLELASFQMICGVKDSSNDLNYAIRLLINKPASFSLLSGDDPLSYPLLSLGAEGHISVLANAYPKEMLELVETLDRDLFFSLYPLFTLLFKETNPAPIKALLHLLGKDSGLLRKPLTSASKLLVDQINQNLRFATWFKKTAAYQS